MNHSVYFYWLRVNKDSFSLQIRKAGASPGGGVGGLHLPFMSLEPVVSVGELNTIKSSGSGDDIGQP